MTRVLPPLYEGHAPIFLHQAFQEALDAYEDWGLDAGEPAVDLDGRPVPISSVFGRMRTCTDLLPVRTLDSVKDVLGSRATELDDDAATYARAAFLMRAVCVERLRGDGN